MLDVLTRDIDIPTRALVSSWLEVFGTSAVLTRQIIDAALSDDSMLSSLIEAVPEFAKDPKPATLSKWLSQRENIFFQLNNKHYRITRMPGSHRWRVRPNE